MHDLIEHLDPLSLTMSMLEDSCCPPVANMTFLPSWDLVSEVKETDLRLLLDVLDFSESDEVCLM